MKLYQEFGKCPIHKCDDCRKAAYLDRFPRSQWAALSLAYDRRLAELPKPLPASFLERLAAEMVANPELFAPVVRFLNEKGEQ